MTRIYKRKTRKYKLPKDVEVTITGNYSSAPKKVKDALKKLVAFAIKNTPNGRK